MEIQNRITQLFNRKQDNILNIFITAGFPRLNDLVPIIQHLDHAGVDLVEVGMPFSDPIADGTTIQMSNQVALDNGMNLSLLLDQLQDIRSTTQVPLLLMGYLNPVMQYGIERFCKDISSIGIDGLILPDLPMREYELSYQKLFLEHNLSNVFLISPQTSEERIRKIDALTQGFIYMVSTDSTTGRTQDISDVQKAYFQRIAALGLNNPRLIGFGIKDNKSFTEAAAHAQGAIIGSAFINALKESNDLEKDVYAFVEMIRGVGVGQV